MANTISGRCLCGQVTWSTSDPVLWSGHCHCSSCRKATASPFTSFFGVCRDGVTWAGELSSHATSDGRVVRKYCPKCGSQMTYQYQGWPDETHLYAGTMDQPELFEPKAHFHYAEKLPWVLIDDDLPKYPGSAETTEPI